MKQTYEPPVPELFPMGVQEISNRPPEGAQKAPNNNLVVVVKHIFLDLVVGVDYRAHLTVET